MTSKGRQEQWEKKYINIHIVKENAYTEKTKQKYMNIHIAKEMHAQRRQNQNI